MAFMSSHSPGFRSPVAVMAFGGWNDAGDAASGVLHHLREHYPSEFVFDLDSEDYFDFQATRPMVRNSPGGRVLSWPRITVTKVVLPDRDLVVFEGPEPSLRWRRFTAELVSEVKQIAPETIVLLGAMLSDTPHSRPLPLSGSAHDEGLARRLGLQPSNYEGPTGIVGVLADAFSRLGLPVVSLWTVVPHYVANPPSPKATKALLNALENVLGAPLDLGRLPEAITEWEQKVNELASDDTEIADYIATLESMSDKVEQSEGTGEEIAAAFEQYLRGRENG